MHEPPSSAAQCVAPAGTRRWIVGGQVQGVGFRPFVYRLAHALGVRGWVRNRLGEVEIEAAADDAILDRFAQALITAAPPLARPQLISVTECVSDAGVVSMAGFAIRDSAASERPRIHVPPDYFACEDCLREVDDPRDRRYRYPFTNCTQCGPRYTLIERLPYDRPNTGMAGFPLCPACQREYADPLDRRFHAEPIACPVCGPQLRFVAGDVAIAGNDAALNACVDALNAGHILAVKGVGGYHLACDARSGDAVATLRARKHRPAKPLAVMFPDMRSAERYVALTADERELLAGPLRPIVLARKRAEAVDLADSVAPDLNEIGVMLPYAPLHHLLCTAFGAPLVMTSGNLSGEPVLTEPAEAQARLIGIADGFLHHDRPILRPADDPVFRTVAGKPRPLRLGRGCAPLELALPRALETPVIAVGGHLKSTVCLAWDDRAVVSPHIADMATPRSLAVFEQVIADLQRLYGVRATRLVCDAHPGYTTTRWALAHGLPVTRVWHHHAHASALAGERALSDQGDSRGGDRGGDRVEEADDWLIFTWDGTGYGEDATLWGGETLHGRPGRWRRVARMRPFHLPGGDKAGREPWRSAAALCWEADLPFTPPHADGELLHDAWRRRLNAPQSSAAGRVFDAAASLTGVLQSGSFEGQGPMYLEASAGGVPGNALQLSLTCIGDAGDALWQTDWEPLLSRLRNDAQPVAQRAADFHASLARAIRRQVERLAETHRFTRIGLTGGVFQNALLARLACHELEDAGFLVALPERLPCNDAGISFGQIMETLYA